MRDDEACREKYGKDWDKYCKLVPYKIIPYVVSQVERTGTSEADHLVLGNSGTVGCMERERGRDEGGRENVEHP